MLTTTSRSGAGPLAGSLSLVSFALASSYAAVLVVLLPNQVAALDPAHKVENLALVTTVSFVFTIAAQPLVGALSDRTRGRYGRRVPWMVAGALVAAVALLAMGGAHSLLALGALWVVAQCALNALDVASSAVVPDEVPSSRRGRTLAVVGAGAVVGGGVAVVLAGSHAQAPGGVYLGLGLVVLLATAVFAVVARRRPVSLPAPGPETARPAGLRARSRDVLLSLAVRPWRSVQFSRTFVARFAFVFAYQLVFSYQLFILTDHVGLATDDANRTLGTLTVVSLVAVMVGIGATGWLSDRSGRRTPFLVGACALLAVSFVVPLVLPTVTGMAVFAVLRGLASGVHMAASSVLVTEVLPDDGASAGKDLGLYNMATNIPQAVAPAVAAVVIARLGGYPALFVVAMVAAVVALVVGVQIHRSGGLVSGAQDGPARREPQPGPATGAPAAEVTR